MLAALQRPTATPQPKVRKLRINLPNGEHLEAPTEEWLAALILQLDPVAQARLFETMRRKNVAYSTPGHYVLHAEPGNFTGLFRRG